MSPGNLCVYEFQFPESAIAGDVLEIEIEGSERMEFLFAYGTSLDKAKSNEYSEIVGGFENDSTDSSQWNTRKEIEYEKIENGPVNATAWVSSPIPQEE